MFSIKEVAESIHVPARLKLLNSRRTLRAFVGNNPEDVTPALFIESVKPHVFYCVSGDFIVNEPMKSLIWQNNHTLSFSALFTDGSRGTVTLDLTTLNSTLDITTPVSGQVTTETKLPINASEL